MKSHETHKRTLVKSITWRVVATILTFSIAIILTGELGLAISISIFDMILKFIGYYIHERAWDHTGWGMIKPNANKPQ